jgi:hypothetical protein
MGSVPATRARRRRRPWFVAVAVVIIGGLAAAVAVPAYLANKAWADACAEADRLDPSWRWKDLLAVRPMAAADSVGSRVVAAAKLMPRRWPDWVSLLGDEDLPPLPPTETSLPGELLPPSGGPSTDPKGRRRDFGSAVEASLLETIGARRLPAGHVSALRKALAGQAGALKRLDGIESLSKARLDRPHRDTFLADVFPNYLSDARHVTLLLRVRAGLRAKDGNGDDALADVRSMLAIAHFAGRELALITTLCQLAGRATSVKILNRILGQTEPSPQALAATQRAIEDELSDALIVESLRGERAYIEDTVRAFADGRLNPADIPDMEAIAKVTGIDRIDEWLHRLRGKNGWSKRRCAEVLCFLTFLIELAKKSPDELRTHADEIEFRQQAMSEGPRRDAAQYIRYIPSERRSRAELRCAAAALAAERFRRETGRWPADFAELVAAKFLAAVQIDPFDGRPLQFKRLSDGLVIYSVGPDGHDDGGIVVSDAEGEQAKDVGFRLWDPAARRQPAGR